MITWTETARAELERHIAAARTQLIAVGADADEVAGDLERHVEAELGQEGIRVATEADVRRVLVRMGGLEAGLNEGGSRGGVTEPARKPQSNPLVTVCCIALGVVLPAVTLGFEFFTRLCSSEMFDPMPTLVHVLLIALVPAANGLALYHVAKRRDGRSPGPVPRWLTMLNGAAVAVAAVYALAFAMLTPVAVLAIVFCGIGLLPLAPLLSLITGLICRTRLRREAGMRGESLAGWAAGLGLAVVLLLAAETPAFLTEAGARMTRSENTETVQRGLNLLRALGSEDRLLSQCYPGRNAGASDLAALLVSSGRRVGEEEARALFYRVTGKPFNLVPVPERFRLGNRARLTDDWAWDADTGGEVVGQRLKNLSLAGSRIDGTLDGRTLTSYVEWTLVFKNTAQSPQEARAQILLPPGGVVSRLTLWVNGEEREAAFAGRAQVREAYQEVAVRQRRDPVLVTTKGPGRVLMQCFPVPAGGEMKVRIGVTAPLLPVEVAGAWRGRLKLPEIIEQNFGTAPDFTHNVWLESTGAFALESGELRAEKERNGSWAMHGAIARRAGQPFPVVSVSSEAGAGAAWAAHARRPGKIFVQSLREAERVPARELVLVVDGSKAIGPFVTEIADAIAAQGPEVRIRLLLAGDLPAGCPSQEPAEAARWLRTQTFEGGQDNLDTLSAAWDLAAETRGDVLWIHGAQPHGWQSFEALLQKENRRPGRVGFRAFAVVQGANVILEKLDGMPRVTAVPRWGSLGEDLRAEFQRSVNGGGWVFERACVAADSVSWDPAREEKAAHIARLWAADEVDRLMAKSASNRPDAVALAGDFQLVTAVSGAVVLETEAQFKAAGLTAVDPATAPNIPEPATVALILGGAAFVFIVWRKRRRA